MAAITNSATAVSYECKTSDGSTEVENSTSFREIKGSNTVCLHSGWIFTKLLTNFLRLFLRSVSTDLS